ncbi:MAG: protein-glutamate O-methyltransferase CheR [Desulfovibrio sp.]|nr:protein-glutamate O-methyltransferase CheR [Desulfovibrio sp.]MCA1986465.1 protein-glutamate O-methyltransferase CheR [Desulfovibrio sp.]
MAALFSSGIAERKEIKIGDSEFAQLRDYIYELSGIYIADNRKYLLENRLSGRLKSLNLKDFGEYFYYLRFDPNKRNELTKLYEVITTNETSFYRNPPQLKVFQDKVLADVLEEQRKNKSKRLHIWSAGCSTGEEPYTLAMIIHEVLGSELPTWSIKITANDLSEAVLRSAREGVYTDYALRTTPKEIITKYFTQEGQKFRVKPEVKRLVSFGHINLNDRMAVKRVERSQIIFCRNVIIYFDDAMKKRVISSFYDNLLPGGYLLIGHSESLHNITRAFKPVHHPGAIIYMKE